MIERKLRGEKLKNYASKLMSNMTESAIMIKTLRTFEVVIGFEGRVNKGKLPGRIDKSVAKQGRATLGHTGRFSGKLPGLPNSRVKTGIGEKLAGL